MDFSIIVAQLQGAAKQPAPKSAPLREKEVKESMAGFVYLKDWRVAHPTHYRYAKDHGIDYSHLRKLTSMEVYRQLPQAQKEAVRLRKRQLMNKSLGAPRASVWTSKEVVLALAKDWRALGGTLASFHQRYTGAAKFIAKAGLKDELRIIFGLRPHWTISLALAEAMEFAKAGGTRKEFRKDRSFVYRFLVVAKQVTALDPIFGVPMTGRNKAQKQTAPKVPSVYRSNFDEAKEQSLRCEGS